AASFFELLTGRRATSPDGAPAEVLRRIAFEAPPTAEPLSSRALAPLRPIFARALAKNPADRYADGDALAEALEGFLRLGSEAAGAKRRRLATAAPIATAAALAIFGAGSGLFRGAAPAPAPPEVVAALDAAQAAVDARGASLLSLWEVALAALGAGAGDPALEARVRATLHATAPAFADEAVTTQALTLQGKDAGHRRYRTAAERALPLVPGRCGDLLAAVAFTAFVGFDFDASARAVERVPPGARDVRHWALASALAARGVADAAQGADADARLAAIHPADAAVDDAALGCALFAHADRMRGRDRTMRWERVGRWAREAELRLLRPARPREARTLLRCLKIRIDFERGDYASARHGLDLVDLPSLPRSSGVAMKATRVALAFCEAEAPGAPDREERAGRAWAALDALLDDEPAAFAWICDALSATPWRGEDEVERAGQAPERFRAAAALFDAALRRPDGWTTLVGAPGFARAASCWVAREVGAAAGPGAADRPLAARKEAFELLARRFERFAEACVGVPHVDRSAVVWLHWWYSACDGLGKVAAVGGDAGERRRLREAACRAAVAAAKHGFRGPAYADAAIGLIRSAAVADGDDAARAEVLELLRRAAAADSALRRDHDALRARLDAGDARPGDAAEAAWLAGILEDVADALKALDRT
ncbi:MAG TPA: hypothetical protein VEI02_11980, partial [Planctomycetota bacterium]|nr:hypothetical protein [Planctomycetota bacterium]